MHLQMPYTSFCSVLSCLLAAWACHFVPGPLKGRLLLLVPACLRVCSPPVCACACGHHCNTPFGQHPALLASRTASVQLEHAPPSERVASKVLAAEAALVKERKVQCRSYHQFPGSHSRLSISTKKNSSSSSSNNDKNKYSAEKYLT